MAIERLIRVLRNLNDGRFHSGAELGKMLQITRSAIWKMTKQLERHGVTLESIVGRGYRLKSAISFIDIEKLHLQLSPQAEKKINAIELFETSTCLQSYLSSRIYESSKIPRACLCEYLQPSHRSTHKPPIAQQLNLALLWQFDNQCALTALMTVASVATNQVIQQFLGHKQQQLHADGSICVNDNIIARVKTTTRNQGQSSQFAVIDISINANNMLEDGTLEQNATSLAQLKHKLIDRNELAARLINQLCYCLTTFQQSGDKLFIDEWQQLSRANLTKQS